MDRSILITGCSSGIGLCAAETLKSRGYRVFATARKAEDVAKLAAQGFDSLALDLNDPSSIKNAVAAVLAQTGGALTALFNNAGYGQPGAIEDLSRDVLREQFETNVFGLMELTNLIIPVMRAQGHGRIVQMSSILGVVAMPYRGAYNASKFALEGLSDSLRLELRGSGIYVSSILPGPIVSRFRDNTLNVHRFKIDTEHSVHKEAYAQLVRNTQATKDKALFTLPPSAVVKKLIHALESPRPKPHYYVTVPAHVLSGLKRILPTRAMDWIIEQISKIETKTSKE